MRWVPASHDRSRDCRVTPRCSLQTVTKASCLLVIASARIGRTAISFRRGGFCRGLTAASLVLMALGCGQQQEEATEPAPPSTPQAAPATDTAPSQANTEQAYAHVRVVGLDGEPIAGMEPIATKQANAFDPPVARGPATDEEGRSYVVFPRDQWVYIRAWDRSSGLFANNFFDIPPGEGTRTDDMEIVMVPGTKLKAKLMGADGAPAAGENVGLTRARRGGLASEVAYEVPGVLDDLLKGELLE